MPSDFSNSASDGLRALASPGATTTRVVRARSLPPLLVTVVLVCTPIPATGQVPQLPQRLDSGTVVRLQLQGGRRQTGRLVAPFALGSTALRMCPWPGPPCELAHDRFVEQPAQTVVAMEVRRGSYARVGATIGTAVGLGLGIFVLEGGFETDTRTTSRLGGLPRVLSAVGSVAFIGAFGAMIGSAFSRWEPFR